MSTAIITRLGSDAWNAELYQSLSFASSIAAAVKSRAAALMLAVQMRRLVSKLENILEDVHRMVEGKKPLPQPDDSLTPQRTQSGIDTIQMISRVLSSTYDSAKRKRLTNNSLLSTPLSRLNELSDEFADLADWLEVATSKPEDVDNIFQRAAREREHGDIYDLSRVD